MGACTIPSLLGFRRWAEDTFGDLCAEHDRLYDAGFPRREADVLLATGVMRRGYFWFGVMAYVVVRLFGWMHYKPVERRS